MLIPWDPNSSEHVDRMVEQRKHCGWYADKVPTEWKDAYLSGDRCIYWLVSTIPSTHLTSYQHTTHHS
jgi:hypothetical protein